MKKVILTVVFSIVGLFVIGFGSLLAVNWISANTVSFKKYMRFDTYYLEADYPGPTKEERDAVSGRIWYPGFSSARPWGYVPELTDCYNEVDNACWEYAGSIARKYSNNADLDFTVDYNKKTLTIVFTGTGYPEDGEPESLDRTYIFDIEGVGANKLPILINREEIIGY